MTIAAFLDQEDDKEIAKINELTPEAYKGLTTALSIDKAEQSILDEVTGVDGDDDNDEAEELAEEENMRSLFQSLYEIDPDTKEPFVKGSAYDLKKWDDNMICFAFGQPELVIALEEYLCPGERYLQKMFDRVDTKESMLSRFIRSHNSHLDAGLVNKDFAKGYAAVMGHPLQNVRMESFTNDLTGTNYKIAMEEMTQQQMALAAGGAILGIGLVYKMIQWFARALNKNTMATASIGQNFSAYFERKEMLKNGSIELSIAKESITDAVNDLVKDFDSNIKGINDVPSKLKQAFNGNNASAAFDLLNSVKMQENLKGKVTPFMNHLLNGKVDANWWNVLDKITEEAIKAQTTISANIETMLSARRFDEEKPAPIEFGFLSDLTKLLTPLGIQAGTNGFVSYNASAQNIDKLPGGNFEECINSFVSVCDSQLFMNQNGDLEVSATVNENGLKTISLKSFEKFSSEYLNNLVEDAKKIETLADKFHGQGDEKDKTDKVEVASKRNRIKLQVKEFKLVSNVLRFVIRVRNQLGTLAVAMGTASENTLSKLQSYFKGIGQAVGGVVNSSKQTLANIGSGYQEGANGKK